jgi:hypothetical protein
MLQNLTFIFHNPYTLRVYSSEKPKATIYTYGFIIDFI